MRKNSFIITFLVITALIMLSGFFSLQYLFKSVPDEKNESIYYQNIIFEDNYNSTFSLDVKFTTQKPYFLVREKINISGSLKRIYNNSILPISSVDFALVTSEGQYMPFQGGHTLGIRMNRRDQDFYYVYYSTFLNLSSKYSGRLTVSYVNISNPKLIEYDAVFIGPLIEVQPLSIELQTKWSKLQIESTNKTISLALLVVVLTLATILMKIIDKNEKHFKNFLAKFSENISNASNMEDNMKNVDFKSWRKKFLYSALIIVFLSFVLLISGIIFNNAALIDLFKFVLPVGIAFLSFYFSSHSIVISNKAGDIASASDIKMKIIASADFMEVVDNLSSFTKQSLNKLDDPEERSTLLIRWLVGMKRAIKLKDFAEQDERDSIVVSFRNLMKKLPWDKKELENHEIILIVDIYNMIWELNIQEGKKDLIDIFEKYIADKKEKEGDTELFNRTFEKIEKEIDSGDLNKVFNKIQYKIDNKMKIVENKNKTDNE